MKLRMKVAIGAALVLIAGAAAAGWWLPRAYADGEADFQTAADAKRINDVHKIAELVEAYRDKTGRLPFDGLGASGLDDPFTVLVGAPKAERELASRGNPLGQEPPTATSADLLRVLRSELGAHVTLPVDPQRGETGAPNAYYVRFKPGGEYMVAGFLRRPNAIAAPIAPGVSAYAVRSEQGAWGGPIWAHARAVSQVSEAERLRIAQHGQWADEQFARYMDTSTGSGN